MNVASASCSGAFYSHVSVGPIHPDAAPVLLEDFEKNFTDNVAAILPKQTGGKTIEPWPQNWQEIHR